jgi:hypothetical protein
VPQIPVISSLCSTTTSEDCLHGIISSWCTCTGQCIWVMSAISTAWYIWNCRTVEYRSCCTTCHIIRVLFNDAPLVVLAHVSNTTVRSLGRQAARWGK